LRKKSTWAAIVVLVVALVILYVWTKPDEPLHTTERAPELGSVPSSERLAGAGAVKPESAAGGIAPPAAPTGVPRPSHPLLGLVDQAVLAEGDDDVRSTADAALAEVIRTVLRSAAEEVDLAPLTVDYPIDETVFPPEIVAPTFLWHEPTDQADTWLVDVSLEEGSAHLYVLSPGNPPPRREIDPECIAKNNEIYQPTPYQASAKSWTPGEDAWAKIKQLSAQVEATITVIGFCGTDPSKALSRGRLSITTSEDPVGAPIFYRDVPLAPAVTQKGVIAPLGEFAVTLIGWRLRDIGRPESRLLLTNVPTCTNCHSFSADGNTLGMDLNGPQGDDGAYVFAPITREMVIEEKDVISWNSFSGKSKGQKTIGFLSRVSPDGQYVATTLNEQVFVCNFLDYKFLQVFYPTRGILGYYSRATGQIKTLPGADDPNYVHCDPVWTPDGEFLVFARRSGRDADPIRSLPNSLSRGAGRQAGADRGGGQ